MTRRAIVLGSRGSRLALWQSRHVQARLKEHFPHIDFSIEIIHTQGDKILDVPLSKIGDKGLFTKEIENALSAGRIDLAVHSLKDMPTRLAEGLILAAVTEREEARDAWVARAGLPFGDLGAGDVVATSSLRRRCQILNRRPDLKVVDIRGNLDTRLKKLDAQEELSGIILASAGLIRMGWVGRITEVLSLEKMLPAVGQGALGIQVRGDDEETRRLVTILDCPATNRTTRAERAFLARLEGGCQVPIGAYGEIDGDTLRLEGMVGSLDGKRVLRDSIRGTGEEPEALGRALGERLLAAGADRILAELMVRQSSAQVEGTGE